MEQGDIVYTDTGQECEYISSNPGGGHIVIPIIEVEDYEEPVFEKPIVIQQAWQTPPVPKYDEEIAKRKAELSALHAELSDLRQQIHETRQSSKKRNDAIQSIEKDYGLHNLSAWFNGEVTHLVRLNYDRVEIGTVEGILGANSEGRHRKAVRLCSLFYDPEEKRYFPAHAGYGDGGGSITPVMMATSYENAVEIAIEAIKKKAQKATTDKRDIARYWKSLQLHGVQVPDDMLEEIKRQDEAHKEKALENAKRDFEKAKKRLEEAQREAGT